MRFRLAGRDVELAPEDLAKAAWGLKPAPVRKYAIEVGGRRYPPKQLVARMTGLGLSEFTTQEAIRVMRVLGAELVRL